MSDSTAQAIQKILHATLEPLKKRELELANLANQSFSGDVREGGETVKIIEESDVSIHQGNLNGDIDYYDKLTPNSQELRITNIPYINITMSDIEEQQLKTSMAKELITRAIARGMYKFKLDVDSNLASTYVSCGLFPMINGTMTNNNVTISISNAFNYLKYMKTSFLRGDLGEFENDWCAVLPPEYVEKLELDTSNIYTIPGYENRVKGWKGTCSGWQIFQSNAITADQGGYYHPLFLVRGQSLALAMQKDPTFKDSTRPNKFETSYAYRIAYGYKMYRPDKAGTFSCNFS